MLKGDKIYSAEALRAILETAQNRLDDIRIVPQDDFFEFYFESQLEETIRKIQNRLSIILKKLVKIDTEIKDKRQEKMGFYEEVRKK